MKRRFCTILMVFAVIIALSGMYVPQVQAYEQYWNGDSNYVLVHARMGVAKYADQSSAVLKKEGDTKVIAMNIIYVDADRNTVTATECWYFAYSSEPRMYYYNNRTNEWVKIGGASTYDMMRNSAQVAWKAIYGYNWS